MKTLLTTLTLTLAFGTFAQEDPVVMTPPPLEEGYEDKDHGYIVRSPDVQAQFEGGKEALNQFVANEVNYPEQAKKDKIAGRVYLYFIVKKNGDVVAVKVQRGAHPLLDQEAVRVAEAMPKWIPGEKDGEKVNSVCRLPINFALN